MAEPTIRPIREADVKQIHEIEKACFAMPWSEESILRREGRTSWALAGARRRNGGGAGLRGHVVCASSGARNAVAVRPDCRGEGIRQADFHGADRPGEGEQHSDDDAGGAPLEHGRAEPVSRLQDARQWGIAKRYYEDNKEDALIMYRDFVYPEQTETEA